MISFKEYVKRVDEAQKGNTYSYEKDSGAKGLAHKVGDSVWAKHPTEKYKTLAGKVTKIGRTFTTLQHKDGTEGVYKHADVSSDFEKLNPNPYRKNESEEMDEGQTALHLLPPAGDTRKVLKGKSDFNAHISANAGGSKKHRGDDGRTYHVKNGRVHGVWNSEAGTGVVYTSSKNESEELDESGWIGGVSKWKEAVNAKHGHALPTFKKVAQPGSPGKSTTYARSSQTGNIIGVYQHHNKSGTVHESVELDEAEGLTTKKNQNGGHDVYHNGTHIGHVEQKSMPWLRGKTIKKVYAKKPNGDSVVVDSDDSGKNTIESAKKTLLKHHLSTK